MQQAERGALPRLQQGRLAELLAKVEVSLAKEVPTLRSISRINESARLVREAEAISEQAQREVNDLLLQYLAGNKNQDRNSRP